MSFSELIARDKPERSAFDMGVEVSGGVLTVKAGRFRVFSEDFELTEDEEYVATQRPCTVYAKGFLVQQRSDGEVRLIVEEELDAEGYVPEIILYGHPEYRTLEMAFSVVVPPETSSFDGLNVEIKKIIPNLERTKAGE